MLKFSTKKCETMKMPEFDVKSVSNGEDYLENDLPDRNHLVFGKIPDNMIGLTGFHAVYEETTNQWSSVNNNAPASPVISGSDKLYYLQGRELFKTTSKGIKRVSNAQIKIIKYIKKWLSEKESEDYFLCQIACEKWDSPEEIEIPIADIKDIYRLAIKKHPEIIVSKTPGDSLEAYISDVISRDKNSWEEVNEIKCTGWFTLNGAADFHICPDGYYSTWSRPSVRGISIPERARIFSSGLDFLRIGNFQAAITMLFLYSHLGFASYWMKKARHSSKSILYLRGMTGSLKTSVAREICNIFETNESKKMISFGSTKASFRDYILACKDGTALLDDFSNSNSSTKKDAEFLFETAIRNVGDGQVSSKHFNGGIYQEGISAGLVVTGEDDPEASISSQLRMVTVQVERGTFSGQVLRSFQKAPDVMRKYFSLYVDFLCCNHDAIIATIQDGLSHYRGDFIGKISEPRYQDAAMDFFLQIDFLILFARWCHQEETVKELLASCREIVLNVFAENETIKKDERPEQKFLTALRQIITKKNIASNEAEYVSSIENGSTCYFGFCEEKTGTMWLTFSDIYDSVRQYWIRKGNNFLTTERRLKEILAENGISICKKNGKGEKEFLIKSKKGTPRKRMLVIRKSYIDEDDEKER